VLIIGTQFSNLYTTVDTGDGQLSNMKQDLTCLTLTRMENSPSTSPWLLLKLLLVGKRVLSTGGAYECAKSWQGGKR
jgi:hypothetical protein